MSHNLHGHINATKRVEIGANAITAERGKSVKALKGKGISKEVTRKGHKSKVYLCSEAFINPISVRLKVPTEHLLIPLFAHVNTPMSTISHHPLRNVVMLIHTLNISIFHNSSAVYVISTSYIVHLDDIFTVT